MIWREHQSDTALSRAAYSPCEAYRYRLSRQWGDAAPWVWVMLNPSTADERANDPTIERCERRARAAGAGGIEIVNLFAFRATQPAELKAAADPIGPENDTALSEAALRGPVLCGWGFHGAHLGRDQKVRDLLTGLGIAPLVLGLTAKGLPRHPLYMPYSAQPLPWAD